MDLEAHLRELLDATPDAMVAVDASGTIRWANAQCATVFGFEPAELVGTPYDLLVPEAVRGVHREHRESYLAYPTARPMGPGLLLEGRRKDGSTFPAEISLSVSRAGQGTVVLAAVRDVTERRRAEQELQEARRAADEAEMANRAKTDFLSRVSHELRTPLNAIIGFAQVLDLGELSESQRYDVGHIANAGNHLLGLINDILDISRIESGQLALSPEPVSVTDLLGEVTAMVAPLAAKRGIEIITKISDDPHVVADRRRLKQVLLNLLSNAIKYNSANGTIILRCDNPTSGRVRIEVADTGAGIPPELMHRLFDPFDRLDAGSSGTEGSGLGLALSLGLVAQMDGTLSAASEPGSGSTFSIDLPAALAESPGQQRHRRARVDEPGGRRGTLLYIEDNASNVTLMERIVSRRPEIELLTALTGSTGIAVAQERRPSMILLDNHLPDIDGAETLARLLAEPTTRGIPIVLLSADASPHQIQRFLDRGATDYVTKPLDVSIILDLIDRHMPRSADPEEPSAAGAPGRATGGTGGG